MSNVHSGHLPRSNDSVPNFALELSPNRENGRLNILRMYIYYSNVTLFGIILHVGESKLRSVGSWNVPSWTKRIAHF